ncbi:hypothetical protein MTO96_016580, partial [Rhipicephalus appendiculatus]
MHREGILRECNEFSVAFDAEAATDMSTVVFCAGEEMREMEQASDDKRRPVNEASVGGSAERPTGRVSHDPGGDLGGDNWTLPERRTLHPRAQDGAPSDEFKCPEQFGYYADDGDCSKYFVCVFGDALHESCTGGLYFSVELQTCDWPRNVQCAGASRKATPAPAKKETYGGSQRRSVRTTTTLRTTTPSPPSTRHQPTASPEYQTLYDDSKHEEDEEEEESEEEEDSTEAPDDTVQPSLEGPRKSSAPKSNSYDPQQPQYDEAVPQLVNSDGKVLGSDNGRPDKFIPRTEPKQPDSLSVFVKPLYRNTGDQKDKESDQVFKRDQTAILAAPSPHLEDDVVIPSVYGGGRAQSLGNAEVGGRKDVVLVTYPRDRYQYSSGSNYNNENEFRTFLQDQQRQQLPAAQPDVQRVLSDSSVRPSSRGRNRDARFYPRTQQVPQQTLVAQIPPPALVTPQRAPVTQTYENRYPPTQRVTQAPTRVPTYPSYQDYDHNYQLQSEYAYPDDEEPYPTTTTTPKPTRRIKYRTTTPTTTTTTTARPVTRRAPPKGFSRPATRPPVPTTPASPPARPRNLYATPTPLETAGRCEARKCRLPDCHCGGAEIPGDLPPQETPQ